MMWGETRRSTKSSAADGGEAAFADGDPRADRGAPGEGSARHFQAVAWVRVPAEVQRRPEVCLERRELRMSLTMIEDLPPSSRPTILSNHLCPLL